MVSVALSKEMGFCLKTTLPFLMSTFFAFGFDAISILEQDEAIEYATHVKLRWMARMRFPGA